MIFPDMDPYLEDTRLWPGVHNRFVVYLADYLQPQLRPRYIAAVEERVYLEGPEQRIVPDVIINSSTIKPLACRRCWRMIRNGRIN
ncbi:MAG: DUF4058 family protein [Gemmataceae bacterium]